MMLRINACLEQGSQFSRNLFLADMTSKGQSPLKYVLQILLRSRRGRDLNRHCRSMRRYCRKQTSSEVREDIKIPTYKPHTNHKRSSVRSHSLAPTTICDLSHSLCWRPLTDLGHINSVTYVCHPLWFVCGHRKGILTSPLSREPKLLQPHRFPADVGDKLGVN